MNKYLLLIVILLFSASCSRKNNGFVNKKFHELTTWNNTLYNGQVAFDEVQNSKKTEFKDDYFTILPVEYYNPFELSDEIITVDAQPNFKMVGNNGLQLGGENSTKTGYAKSIEKSLKAIEKHSMQIKGKEYNKMMSRTYMLLGKSYLYQGKYNEALVAFQNVEKNLPKSKELIKSKIYVAETQSYLRNTFDAEEIFIALEKQKMKKSDKALYAKKYAQLLINQKKIDSAIQILEVAYKYNKSKNERGRFRFIQGQLYELKKDEENAYKSYEAAYKKKPNWEMEVKSQIAMARLYNKEEKNFEQKKSKLSKLLKKGEYQSKKNELYYALALLSDRADSTRLADLYYQKSLKEKESDPEIRGEVYKSLGDRFFKKRKYIQASLYYDSALAKVQRKQVQKPLQSLVRTMKKLTERYYRIKKNDSILRIVAMNDDERKTFFINYIEKLKEKEAKEQKEIEQKANVFSTETAAVNDFSGTFSTSKEKFYFYNTSVKIKGQQEFKRIWGDRTLADNWRTKIQGATFANQEAKLLGQENAKDPQRFNVDFYVEKIPKDALEIEKLKAERDTAELFLGIAYFNDFKDSKSSTETLEHLLQTPPKKEEVKIQALYNLFKANEKNNLGLAEKYKNQLVTQYPNSKYTEFVLNPNVNYFTENSSEAIDFYKKTYEEYQKGNYALVQQNAIASLEKFPKDAIIAKFSLLSALCDAKLGNAQAFFDSLTRVSVVFEGTPEAEKAKELLQDLQKTDKNQKNIPQEMGIGKEK